MMECNPVITRPGAETVPATDWSRRPCIRHFFAREQTTARWPRIRSTDFDQKDRLIEAGYQAGLAVADKIIREVRQYDSGTDLTIGGLTLSAPLDRLLPDSREASQRLIGQVKRSDLEAYLFYLLREYRLLEVTDFR